MAQWCFVKCGMAQADKTIESVSIMNASLNKNQEALAMPTASAAVSADCESSADQSISNTNRQRLQSLYAKGGYSSVKFWVSPNSLTSEDECIAEVADALESFQKDKADGKLKPIGDDFHC